MASARCVRSATPPARTVWNFSNWQPRSPLIANVTEYPLEDANEALLDIKNASLDGQAVVRVAQSLSKLY